MMYLLFIDGGSGSVGKIAEGVKAIYLKFTCRKEESKESGKTGE